MRRKLICAWMAACLLGMPGCGQAGSGVADAIVNKTFVYENEGCGGEFSIQINEDGTFSYYEGFYSSYIGVGSWALDGGILVLSDDDELGYPLVNRFKVKDGDLVFLSEDSSNFLYVDVADGERFVAASGSAS